MFRRKDDSAPADVSCETAQLSARKDGFEKVTEEEEEKTVLH